MKRELPSWLRTAGSAAAAFFLALALWTAVLWLLGVYPFGDKSILITDLSTQYVEYHAALYDMVRGGDSVLFTWNSGLGMNFWGLIAYYLSSPLTLVMFLFPRAMLTEAMLCIISLKMALSALTVSLFLRRVAKVKGIVNLLCSLLYALSGYAVVFCFNLMFLDGMVWLPLVVMAARYVYEKKRLVPFVLALSGIFISNYYISYMAGVFTFLLFLVWLFVGRQGKRENLRHLGRFMAGTCLAAGLAAFLLLPAFFSLTGGYQQLHGVRITLSAAANPLAFPGKLAWGAFDSVTYSGTPNLYCGLLTIGLFPAWFTHRDTGRREKWAVGALFLFLFLSMWLYDLDLMWHVFQPPTWFLCRYSFVVIFLLIGCAARVLSRPDGIRWSALLGGFLGMTGLMLLGWCGVLPFAGEAAVSIGWLLGYLAVMLLMVLLPRVGFRRALSGVLLAAVCVEVTGSALQSLRGLDKEMHFTLREDYAAYMERNQNLMESLNSLGDNEGFYRVENAVARDANDGLHAGYHAVSHYSSVSNQHTFAFLGDLGMSAYVNHRYLRYFGATSALDALLGVKYVWDNRDIRYGMEQTEAKSVGGSKLYKNKNALPLVYFADKAVLDMETAEQQPFLMQNRLISSLTGSAEDCYTLLPAEVSSSTGQIKAEGKRTVLENVSTLKITIDNPRRGHILLYLENNFNEKSLVYANGRLLNYGNDRLVKSVIELGEQPAGQITVEIDVRKTSAWFGSLQAAVLDEEAYDTAIDRLREGTPDSLEVGDTSVRAVVSAPRDGVLFTSIPADAGWTAWLDGERVEWQAAAGAFIAVPVDEGTHTLEMRFSPQGFQTGVVLSAVSAAVLVGLIGWELFKKRKRQEGGSR